LDTCRVQYFVCSNYFYVFSYSVACYLAFIVLRKNKNQKTKNKKKEKNRKQSLPPVEPTVGVTKPPFQLAVVASQPAATHTGPAAIVANLPQLETAAVLTAVCGVCRYLPLFGRAAGIQPPFQTAVRGYFCQC
jgi:hypothetical protein